MGLETRLALKQTQKLVMTAMLQQAITLLPMARLELVQAIQQELPDNPLLEEVSLAEAWLAPKGPVTGSHQPERAPPAPAAAKGPTESRSKLAGRDRRHSEKG